MNIQGLLQNRQFGFLLVFIGVFTTLFLVFNIFIVGGDGFFTVTNTITSPAVALLTCFFFFEASTNKKDVNSRSFWLGMAWGFGLWGLADCIWGFYSIYLNETLPYPSIADLIWLVGYGPLYYALFTRLKTLKIVPSWRQNALILGLNSTWILLTAIFIFLPILQDFDSGRLMEGIVNLLFPLLDVGLVILASMILILLKEGRFAIIWRLIFFGIFIMTVSDLLYSYASWNDLYYPGGHVNTITVIADTTYTIAYICAGFGILIYRYIWDITEKFVISLSTMPAARYATFVGTNRDNKLITISNNFFCLVNGNPETDYYKQPLDKILGMQPETLTLLLKQILKQDFVCHELVRINTLDKQERSVWITAMAIYNPGREFVGANIAFSADIEVDKGLRLPINNELLGMLNYLLSLAGSRPQDEIQTMELYFLDVIQMLSSMLYQFGGTNFKTSLFKELNRTIQQKNLRIRIDDQNIILPEGNDGEDLAASLIPLLQTAINFTSDLIGEQIVKEEIKEIEKPFSVTVLRDLDKFQLRAFHLNGLPAEK